MTRNFASLPLARLYEKQGYIADALEIYRAIDTHEHPDAQSIAQTISRLEAQSQALDAQGHPADLKYSRSEDRQAAVAHMLETWVQLVRMQKQIKILKKIKNR